VIEAIKTQNLSPDEFAKRVEGNADDKPAQQSE